MRRRRKADGGWHPQAPPMPLPDPTPPDTWGPFAQFLPFCPRTGCRTEWRFAVESTRPGPRRLGLAFSMLATLLRELPLWHRDARGAWARVRAS